MNHWYALHRLSKGSHVLLIMIVSCPQIICSYCCVSYSKFEFYSDAEIDEAQIRRRNDESIRTQAVALSMIRHSHFCRRMEKDCKAIPADEQADQFVIVLLGVRVMHSKF